MSGSVYTFASFSRGESLGFRLGGPGLGNLLFPWARSVSFAKRHELQRINSTWRTVKLGPILRGEFDKRFYSDMFKEHEIGGINKFLLLNTSRKVAESDAKDILQTKSHGTKVVVFSGMEGLFEAILDDSEIIKKELLKMVLPHHKEQAEKFDSDGICVHIRMGDFTVAENEDIIRQGAWNYRLPMKWYVDIVNRLRSEAGYDIEVNIFSDGTDEDLAEILKLPNTRRRFYGSAIADMLALSRSRLLIASASTFSMWASYLGRMPTIWFPGTHRQKLYKEEEAFEGEIDYGEPFPSSLIETIKKESAH